MKRIVLFTALLVVLVLVSGTSCALAHPAAPEQNPAAPVGFITARTLAAAVTAQTQPAKTESELKHNIVKYLGYSLFVLIVLAFGSGFFKKKKIYRKIHHVLAFTLIGVAILHGILALTL
jgi:cytochrome b561